MRPTTGTRRQARRRAPPPQLAQPPRPSPPPRAGLADGDTRLAAAQRLLLDLHFDLLHLVKPPPNLPPDVIEQRSAVISHSVFFSASAHRLAAIARITAELQALTTALLQEDAQRVYLAELSELSALAGPRAGNAGNAWNAWNAWNARNARNAWNHGSRSLHPAAVPDILSGSDLLDPPGGTPERAAPEGTNALDALAVADAARQPAQVSPAAQGLECAPWTGARDLDDAAAPQAYGLWQPGSPQPDPGRPLCVHWGPDASGAPYD